MLGLLALLWCVYLSDCFVRLPQGAWILRAGARNRVVGAAAPDLPLFGDRVALSWTSFLPWRRAQIFSGTAPDVAEATRRLAEIDRHTRWLHVLCGVLFVWIMGGLTILVATDRLLSVLLPWAAGGAASIVAAFIASVVSYTRIHGKRPPIEVWLTLALSPVSLMRAPVSVSVDAASSLHPLAAAAVLCTDAEFLRIARLWYFDSHDLRAAIDGLVRSRGLADRLLAGPAAWEPGVAQFCPRCHGTYTAGARQCPDCGDVALHPLHSH